jgi:hypothetical protein
MQVILRLANHAAAAVTGMPRRAKGLIAARPVLADHRRAF